MKAPSFRAPAREALLPGTDWCRAASSSEPPTSVGLACRPVGAWRRHLVKQRQFRTPRRYFQPNLGDDGVTPTCPATTGEFLRIAPTIAPLACRGPLPSIALADALVDEWVFRTSPWNAACLGSMPFRRLRRTA